MNEIYKLLLGVFIENVKIFGIVVIILLIIIGVCVKILVKKLIKKSEFLEELHDDIIIIKMQEEGRKSFTNTILEIKMKVDSHEKRLDNIDRRCDRRIDNEQSKEYPKIKNRRKKLFTKLK